MKEVNANVNFLTAAINLCAEKKFSVAEDMMEETRNMLQELIQLHSLMNTSSLEMESIEHLLKSLLSKKPKLDAFLDQFVVTTSTTVVLENQCTEILVPTGTTVVLENQCAEILVPTGYNCRVREPMRGDTCIREPVLGDTCAHGYNCCIREPMRRDTCAHGYNCRVGEPMRGDT